MPLGMTTNTGRDLPALDALAAADRQRRERCHPALKTARHSNASPRPFAPD